MPEPTKPGVVTTPTSVKQPVAPVQPVEPVVPEAQPAQTVDQNQQVLPDTSDRTREQFGKLLENNQRLFEANELLREELTRRQQSNQVFQPIQQQPLAPVNPQDFIEVDPVSGERVINEQRLRSEISNLNEKTAKQEQIIQSYIKTAEEREIQRQNREAYTAHPELNPVSSTYDASLADFTRALIYDSLINPHQYGGRNLSFKEAADRVKSKLASGSQPKTMEQTVDLAQTKPVSQEVAQATQEAKEQGSLAVTGQPAGQSQAQSQVYNLEELRRVTRVGSAQDSDRAIALRLQNVDHVRKSSEEET